MTVTKRTISSDAGKVFDPIGWLAPVTIKAKMILQSLWRDNLLWDEPVSSAIENEWINYRCKLPHIENIRISRCLLTQKSRPFDLYGFADASEKAYGAVIYIKTRGTTQKYPQILSAKTKVAPTKSVSLPRLELCAALLLARLVDRVTAAMNCHPREIHAWTDSMIVLQWLQSHPGRWKTFVANRVSEIQEIIPSSSWHHVPGVDNPADCISRGILANELQEHSLWWHGPSWLQTYPDGFIEQPVVTVESEILEEKTIVTTNHANANTVDYSILFRYSSLPKLLRVTAMLLRFGLRYKRKKETRPVGPISINELKEALYCWIRMIQKSEFHEEWNCFVNVKRLDNSSRLLSLNPFFDDSKLIRVGGRLKHAQIDAEMKHPILLPKKNKLVELIILNEHAVTLHGGTQLVLATLRRKYWILGARDLTRKLIRQCAICTRHRGEVVSQMMGDLPAARINPTRPFLKTGVDYAGPITLRVIKGKGHKFFKGYISIFICFVTRAIHLELVTSLSSEAFVAALKRFIGRRGKPSDIYCDNGRTFVGAKRELRFTGTKDFKEHIQNVLTGEEILFHLNPPSAPHFGGLWEAGIKSVKYHLARVMGNQVLSYEEMTTLLIQIEACLNSRPISPLSQDPTDLLPLTPGHFLIGDSLTAVPEPSYVDVSISYTNRWKLVQKLYQNFWRRWSSEYLTRLQQRPKWLQAKPNLEKNDLVLIKDGRFPPLKWKLGRITELHPGEDQLVRVVTVLTTDGIVKRPVSKICILPVR